MGAGSATVITAKELVGNPGAQGESWWWDDLGSHLWGKSRWALELDVQPATGAAYRVRDVFKMPNRLHKLRRLLDGPPKLQPGVVLPVQIDDSDPNGVEIDWKAFAESDGTGQLYGGEPGVRETLRGFVAELRSDGPTPARPEPVGPRPDPVSHPPIEGVDYDTWTRVSADFVREGRPRNEWIGFCEANGFPVGRVEAINTEWYERTLTDEVLRAWYLYDIEPRA
jgi:hypothetical protein